MRRIRPSASLGLALGLATAGCLDFDGNSESEVIPEGGTSGGGDVPPVTLGDGDDSSGQPPAGGASTGGGSAAGGSSEIGGGPQYGGEANTGGTNTGGTTDDTGGSNAGGSCACGATGGAGGAPSGGTSSGGANGAIAGCDAFTNRTGAQDDRTVAWGFGITSSPERCLLVLVGQQVTYEGNFGAHPIGIGDGDTPNPFASLEQGASAAIVTFSTAGTFGFECGNHATMRGAVRVIPP